MPRCHDGVVLSCAVALSGIVIPWASALGAPQFGRLGQAWRIGSHGCLTSVAILLTYRSAKHRPLAYLSPYSHRSGITRRSRTSCRTNTQVAKSGRRSSRRCSRPSSTMVSTSSCTTSRHSSRNCMRSRGSSTDSRGTDSTGAVCYSYTTGIATCRRRTRAACRSHHRHARSAASRSIGTHCDAGISRRRSKRRRRRCGGHIARICCWALWDGGRTPGGGSAGS